MTVANAEKKHEHKIRAYFLPSASRCVFRGFVAVCAADEENRLNVCPSGLHGRFA